MYIFTLSLECIIERKDLELNGNHEASLVWKHMDIYQTYSSDKQKVREIQLDPFRWTTYSTARKGLCPRMLFMALQCLPGSNKNDIKNPLRWIDLLNPKIQRKKLITHLYTHT